MNCGEYFILTFRLLSTALILNINVYSSDIVSIAQVQTTMLLDGRSVELMVFINAHGSQIDCEITCFVIGVV